MKTHNYIKIMVLMVGMICCYACSDDKEDEPKPKSAQLSISTTIQTRAVTTAFATGDKMNLYVKSEGTVTSDDATSNVSASYGSNQWSLSPVVEIAESKKAYLFAFYPYNASYTTPGAIPVDVATQTDYLYSGSAVSVSYSSPQGTLNMQHALSILAFNISKDKYDGDGQLSSIKATNIPLKGTLNVSSGVINSTEKGDYTINANKQIDKEWTAELPQMFSIPFKSTGKDIPVIFLIDGKEYTTNLPEITIETGMKYIFHLVITNNGITILPDLTEKISLNKEGTSAQPGEYGMLKISYTGKTISAPVLSGSDKIAGMIYWGDNVNETYTNSLIHNYTTEGEHNVSIETWGVSQFKIENLVNVEAIDISDF